MLIIRILLLMDNDANVFSKHTCRTILMVADAEPEKRHKNQITFSSTRRILTNTTAWNVRTWEHSVSAHTSIHVNLPGWRRRRTAEVLKAFCHVVHVSGYVCVCASVCGFTFQIAWIHSAHSMRNLNHANVKRVCVCMCLHAKWY